jgi:hypothetical protein
LHPVRHPQFLIDPGKVEIHGALAANQGCGHFSRRLTLQNEAQDFYLALGQRDHPLVLYIFSRFGGHFSAPLVPPITYL